MTLIWTFATIALHLKDF